MPLPVKDTFTYAVPADMEAGIGVGARVLVPFGSRKSYTAIVARLHHVQPEGFETKEIAQLLDARAVTRAPQLQLWQWLAGYYLCSVGEVYKAAVPAGLKIESETFVSVNADYEETAAEPLSERERAVLTFAAQRPRVQLSEISRATGIKNVVQLCSRLVSHGAVRVADRVVDNYRPLTETLVTLPPDISHGDNDALERLFALTGKAPKREALLLAWLRLSDWMLPGAPKDVRKDQLLKSADATAGVLKACCDKGIFAIVQRPVNRFAAERAALEPAPALTAGQQQAYDAIVESMASHGVTLLHGVTSSGKTSIYVRLILDTLARGQQALYLVPEIALTTQLTQRLQRVLGSRLLIYHSKFSDNERVDIWQRLLTTAEPLVVIGVRSAVFLPFARLGMVIVDEEHDSSYKQQDPAPRYNGRDVAIVLASLHGAKTLLGSATPAIDTYHKATTGHFGLVSLTQRYEGLQLPVMQVVDTKLARRKHEMNGLLSPTLVAHCRRALADSRQVILFQNRRGYAPMVRCSQCAWTPKCENCDVTLTYHKHIRTLSCHYCGYSLTLPTVCPVCGQATIDILGYGTERIEDDIDKVFPGEKIARMDLDTTRSKNSYDRIIDDFSHHRHNILVGTQMVTKGLDFDAVSVVGILNADTMTAFPDFRSNERAFCMMEQVAGRAGRKGAQGRVVVQTSDPDHHVIQLLAKHDYLGFYRREVADREKFGYPPFSRIINIYLKHRDENDLIEVSASYSNLLRQVFGSRVLGPEAPLVSRVKTLYIRQITLKMETSASMQKVKDLLRQLQVRLLASDPRAARMMLYYDVDPS